MTGYLGFGNQGVEWNDLSYKKFWETKNYMCIFNTSVSADTRTKESNGLPLKSK